LQLLSLPIRRLSWGCSKDTGRTSSTPVTVVVASCFLHLHITRLSSCHPIPWTGTWIRRNHTTPRARCRLHTALLHLCPPQISADGPRQTPVTAVAHAGYARYGRDAYCHPMAVAWRSLIDTCLCLAKFLLPPTLNVVQHVPFALYLAQQDDAYCAIVQSSLPVAVCPFSSTLFMLTHRFFPLHRLSVPETLEMDHAATVPGWSSAVASPSRLVLPRKVGSETAHLTNNPPVSDSLSPERVSRTTPSHSHTEAGTLRKRAQRACSQCHAHKTKCSGDLPKCKRCESANLVCEYTPTRRRFTNVRFHSPKAEDQNPSTLHPLKPEENGAISPASSNSTGIPTYLLESANFQAEYAAPLGTIEELCIRLMADDAGKCYSEETLFLPTWMLTLISYI
jgi:hypothetical protein